MVNWNSFCKKNFELFFSLLVVIHSTHTFSAPARFAVHKKSEKVRRGGTLSLTCRPIGDRPLDVLWLVDGRPIDDGQKSRWERGGGHSAL